MERVFKLLVLTYVFTTVLCQQDDVKLPKPIIRSLKIHSDIKYTYARTSVNSKILNPAEKAQEVLFRVVLPEEAYITGLVMTIKNKTYDAYVKTKDEAKKEYQEAVSAGQSAAHVFQRDIRNSKDFTVAVNVEPQEKVQFDLKYEELLSRKNKTYKNEININPEQIVPELSISVDIEDILNIINVQVPEFRMNNEIDVNEKENSAVKKTIIAPNKVRVEWSPTVEEQAQLNKEGLNGQMVVKYDVDASENSQQILMSSDGYFVHILRNDDLPVLNKHVVFVLDVSGSMSGQKIEQVKDAMKKILKDLTESDYFSLVLFSVKVIAWGPEQGTNETELNGWDDAEPANISPKEDHVIRASAGNVEKALNFIQSLNVYGGTNILGGLRNGLILAKLGQSMHKNVAVPPESMIIFLTDGQPNSEESDPEKIITKVGYNNNGVTVFSLGFGFDADMNFLKKLSLSNGGFARRIYADSDASLQLQNFYKEVASPVLSNVTFEYLPNQVENTTSENFKNLFSGSDIVVLGKTKPEGKVSGALVANSKNGVQRFEVPKIILLPPIEEKNKTHDYLEKMWAFKTIKTLLDKNTVSKNESLENKAKELALKYSFVTPLTSLVVVKPNDSAVVNDEESKKGLGYGFNPGLSGAPGYFPPPMAPMPPGAGGFAAPALSFSPSKGGILYHKSPGKPIPLPQNSESDKIGYPAPLAHTTPLVFTTVRPLLSHYSRVSWLNQTESEDGLFLEPSLLPGTDVVALNETDVRTQKCQNGNTCRHFIYCVLEEFSDDVSKFLPFQCHIDPKFLGVCCPDGI